MSIISASEMSTGAVEVLSAAMEEEEVRAKCDLLLTNGTIDGAKATGLSFPLLFFLRWPRGLPSIEIPADSTFCL